MAAARLAARSPAKGTSQCEHDSSRVDEEAWNELSRVCNRKTRTRPEHKPEKRAPQQAGLGVFEDVGVRDRHECEDT